MGTGWRRARIALGLSICATSSDQSVSDSGEVSPEGTTPSARSHATATTPRSEGCTPRPLLVLQKSSCGICLQTMKSGRGVTIFTAECSHAFHFHCVTSHVRSGTNTCPVCLSTWKDAPFLSSPAAGRRVDEEAKRVCGGETDPEARVYDDDEPLLSVGSAACRRFNPIPEEESSQEAIGVSASKMIVNLTIVPEFPALVAGKCHDDFAMLLRVRAPASSIQEHYRPPLIGRNFRSSTDVVAVLDARSGVASLRMLKRAVRIVGSALSSSDRLAVVAFTRSSSKRLLPLMRMSSHGQRTARRLVERLELNGDAEIDGRDSLGALADGVRKAAKMLTDRRERNPLSAILLLSDGATASRRRARKLSVLYSTLGFPVHTFGFSAQLDPSSGEPVTFSDGTGNTFSFVNCEASFAQCIGTLLCVAVQDLRLEMECVSSDSSGSSVKLSSLYASVQRSRIQAGTRSGSIHIGDLYAEEEREFLVELKIPATRVAGPVSILSVRCSFVDPFTRETVNGEARTLILPVVQSIRGLPNSEGMKVERLRNRVRTTRAISEARRLAEIGDVSASRLVLAAARTRLLNSASISADEHKRALDAELAELGSRTRHGSDLIVRTKKCETPSASLVLDMVMRLQAESNCEMLTPRSAWREAERLARVAIMRKAMNRSNDLHGLEDARF